MAGPDQETLLVIVGAGASFDCKARPRQSGLLLTPPPELTVGGREWEPREWGEVRPPVTAQLVNPERVLFNQVLNDYPRAAPVVDHLRRRLGKGDDATTLEKALEEYADRNRVNPAVTRQLTSFLNYLRDVLLVCERYMLASTAGGLVTNYTALVNEVMQWACTGEGRRVCFVSFNYDTFLERALEAAAEGFDRGQLATYLHHPRFDLFKPHGSGIWLVEENAAHVGEFRVHTNELKLRESGLRPAMALPVMPKTDLVWTKDQEERFVAVAPQITRVISVGWRAADEGFVRVLTRHAAQCSLKTTAVVGPGDYAAGKSVSKALALVGRAGGQPVIVEATGFSVWLRDERLRDALS